MRIPRFLAAGLTLTGVILGTALLDRHAIVPADQAAAQSDQAKAREGEARKTSTGRNFAAETVVALAPVPAAASGWDSERVWSGQDDWEPALAVDPGNASYVYQLTTRYSGPTACKTCKLPAIIFRRSSDGGTTWDADQFLAQTSKAQNDPEIEVDINGTVHAVWLDAYNPGVSYIKSTDRGATWTARKTFTGKGTKPSYSDKPILAISRDGQHVYIAFNASDSYVVASHDGGNTFSAPVKTNSDTRYWFHNGGAVSAANGNIAWFGAADFSNNYTGDAGVDVIRTANGGVSWTTVKVDTSRQMPDCPWAAGCYLGFLGTSTALAADSAGRLMILYHANDTASAPEMMYVRTSTDGGVTWSARQAISTAGAAVNHAFPAIAAHPTSAGVFSVSWEDDRNGVTTAWNTWYRHTTNGGSSWSSEVRLSDLGSGAPYKTAAGYAFPYGDYYEMGIGPDGRSQVIWAEGASYSGPGGTWYTRGQ
jgi:hypothetical protein